MVALPQDDLSNLNPSTNREWLMKLNWRFEVLEESIADDRETYLEIFDELKKINKNQDRRLEALDVCVGKQDEAIGTLKKRVDGWNSLNSIGVIIASILATLGLTGS